MRTWLMTDETLEAAANGPEAVAKLCGRFDTPNLRQQTADFELIANVNKEIAAEQPNLPAEVRGDYLQRAERGFHVVSALRSELDRRASASAPRPCVEHE